MIYKACGKDVRVKAETEKDSKQKERIRNDIMNLRWISNTYFFFSFFIQIVWKVRKLAELKTIWLSYI